jgi:hypothetical protein
VFDGICVAILIAYFLHFALAALRGGFREDEMMNLWTYWHAGALKSLWASIFFWSPFYRPGGALYYLPLYSLYGLSPQPYRLVQIGILAASIPMVWYLGRLLASSRSVAFLAVLALCYHARLAKLVFAGSFIYDVLCGFFYFAALTHYIHIREKGFPLRPMQLLGFLALYVCALDCKEMAVTLPVIVLIYEFLKRPRWADWKAFFRWTCSVAGPSLIAALLTAIYIYGKTHGSGALTRFDAYRPRYSWHNFVTSNAKFVGELLFLDQVMSPKVLLVLWAAVFIYAFIRQDRALQLMAFWIVIVSLPLAFIRPIRSGACLYLLLFGWAMIFGKLASDLIMLISKFSILIGRRVGVGTATGAIIARVITNRVRAAPIGVVVDATASKLSLWVFRVVTTILVASALALFTQRENQRLRVRPLTVGKKTSRVIEAFRSLGLHPTPGSNILLSLNENSFRNKWNVVFIAYLVWNDHSVRIWLEGVHKLTPRQIANMNYVISVNEFDAKVIRSPEIRSDQ